MGHGVRKLLLGATTALAVPLATFGVTQSARAAITTGVLVVTVTDPLGAPLAGATVSASTDGSSWISGVATAAGTYQLRPPVGDYKVRITSPGGLVDYVPGQATIDGAATYPVVAGQTTTLSEQLTAAGNVQVTLVDRVTGAPVGEGCVLLTTAPFSQQNCNHQDGRYLFAAVPFGDNKISLYDTRRHWLPSPVSITVTPGLTEHTVLLDPAAAIQTVVQAADDPTLHPQFCVMSTYPSAAFDETAFDCSDPTTGALTVGPLPATTVQLLALPAGYNSSFFKPQYGAQWVGPTGGTGDQRLAQRIALHTGTVTQIQPIRVDHAGSISGTITDPSNPDPRRDAFVQPWAPQFALFGIGWVAGPGVAVDAPVNSPYTLIGLGPYAWPVDFQANGPYAEQWSGGAPNRYAATMVQVHPGQTSTMNAVLGPERSVSGTISVAPGVPTRNAWVSVADAVTGDVEGLPFRQGITGPFWAGALSSDPVLLTYDPGDGRTYAYRTAVPTSGPGSTGIVLSAVNSRLLDAPKEPLPSGTFPPYGGPSGVPVGGASASPATSVPGSTAYPPLTTTTAPPPRRWRPAKPWFF